MTAALGQTFPNDCNQLLPMSEAKAMSAEADILRYERQVAQALRSLKRRTDFEPATVDTPLDALLASESGDLDEWGVRNETIRKFFEYILADGPNPAQILRRVFAIGAHMMIEPFSLYTLREKAMMLGESHGAQHWRVKRICTDLLMRKEARSIKAPGQKTSTASAVASEVQKGNSNRIGGRARARRCSESLGQPTAGGNARRE